MKRLEGKVAIVTGASRGIGKAIALAYGTEGAKVVATARTTKAIEDLVAKLEDEGTEALAITADLCREADISHILTETLGRFGRIDILVNNAGLVHHKIDLLDFDTALWRQVVDVNLIAPALLTKAVLPSMIGNGAGKIINISSIGGRKGAKGRSAYRASKAGLINLTESIASEVKKFGIDVNCICPGSVDTEIVRQVYGEREGPRPMRPEEIAELAVFLSTEAASSITGAAIDAFGGRNPLFL